MHKRLITITIGAAMLAASVACAPVDGPTDDEVRDGWRYGYYVEHIVAYDGLHDIIEIAESGTTNAPAATLALNDHYRQ